MVFLRYFLVIRKERKNTGFDDGKGIGIYQHGQCFLVPGDPARQFRGPQVPRYAANLSWPESRMSCTTSPKDGSSNKSKRSRTCII